MGRVTAPFGVQGWIRVHAYTAASENLLAYRNWWLGRDAQWREHPLAGCEVRSGSVIAKLGGCDDRDAAARFKGLYVAVRRSDLPPTGPHEYYWADLIGLKVINGEKVDFGRVREIIATGANDVLVVRGERDRLVPFVAGVVKEVDVAGGVIRIDWSADF
ncbi:MAG: ribosome maturation factor RimM [Betaproteobacteria bacterium]|nr:ribosome maturation factor RimM [Betaproteobacteria bacterium]